MNSQKGLHGVVQAGRRYGLEMNWDKVERRRVRGDGRVEGPGGESVKLAKQAVYLGALVSADGRIGGELNRRIGQASATFSALQRVWKHTRLPRSRKHRIYHACVLPVLLSMAFTPDASTAFMVLRPLFLRASPTRLLCKLVGTSLYQKVSWKGSLNTSGHWLILQTIIQ